MKDNCLYFILKQDFLFYNLFDGTQLLFSIESTEPKDTYDVILLPSFFLESNTLLPIAVKKQTPKQTP